MTGLGLRARPSLPFALAVLTIGAIVFAATAAASTPRARLDDPNDVRGLLDVRRVWFDPEAVPKLWTVVTFAPWTPAQLRDRGFVFLYLDTEGDQGPDYYALLRSDGKEVDGSLWRHPRKGGDVRLADLRIARSSDLALSVRIPFALLQIGGARTVYRWWVVSTFAGRVCRVTCVDRVPDQGTFEQPVGPTPSTTVTPTPTPTPSASPTP